MELFGLGRVCATCRRVITGEDCPSCGEDDALTLTSDIYASARGIEAPPLYDRADRGLSLALALELAALFAAAAIGSSTAAYAILLSMLGTASMLAWGVPALRQRHRLRLIMQARARALPPARWSPVQGSSTREAIGVARPLDKQVIAPLSGQRCLMAVVDVVVRERLAARQVVAEPFLVVDDDGVPTVVTGELWLEPCAADLELPTAQAALEVGTRSLLPARFRPAGVARETRIHDGQRVRVRGRATLEQHPRLPMSYRDPNILTLRGEPRAPVSVAKQPDYEMMVY